jgi:predicted MFS family arabinose efflux permease
MLLVYALSRTPQVGWASVSTVSMLAASVALLTAFIVIEMRSPAPLLPLRIFRMRSLSAANGTALMIGGIAFSQFFLLTLYMQQVLGYSALKTGVAFAATTLSIIVFSNVAQRMVTRYGVRRALTFGLVLDAVSLAELTQLPVNGHYFWDMFPAFVIGGIGLAFSFVPVTIAGLTGISRADAGIASGLINTSRQVGGAIGLAAVTTIVADYTTSGTGAAAVDAGLTHGFRVGFLVLAGMALVGAAIAGTQLRPQPQGEDSEVERIRSEQRTLEEAA